jgi:hypothetical protein
MSNERDCPVCHEAIASGLGEPCALCGNWFHFTYRQLPERRICGVFTDRMPGLIA